MLKFTQEQLTAMGCKTHEELAALMPGLFALQSKMTALEAAAGKIDAFTARLGTVESGLTAATADIDGVKASIPSEAKIKSVAREEATTLIGSAAIPPGSAAPANPGTAVPLSGNAEADALLAQGKFEDAWAKSPELQKEFSSAARFASFQRNAGAAKIFKVPTAAK